VPAGPAAEQRHGRDASRGGAAEHAGARLSGLHLALPATGPIMAAAGGRASQIRADAPYKRPADLQVKVVATTAPGRAAQVGPGPQANRPADMRAKAMATPAPGRAAQVRPGPQANRPADMQVKAMAMPSGRAARIRPAMKWNRAAELQAGAKNATGSPMAHPRGIAAPRHAVLRPRSPVASLAPSGGRAPRRTNGLRNASGAAPSLVPGAARSARFARPPTAAPSLDLAPLAGAAAAASAAPPARTVMLDYRRPLASQESQGAVPPAPPAKPAPQAAIDLDSLTRELWKRFDNRIRLEAERYGRL
jgi:hypothetical protein